MKKYLIPLAITGIVGSHAYAQDILTNNLANRTYFGIRVGGEITCPGKVTSENVGVSMFRNGGGIELGGIVNIPVKANFYLEPGVKFYFNEYSVKKDILRGLKWGGEQVNQILYLKYGMRIPVMAGYHFDFTEDLKVSIFTGPELEIGITGREHLKVAGGMVPSDLYGEEGLKRVNLLWQIGAGVTYRHLYAGVSGGLGMLNLSSESDVSFHENRVTFSVGYNF
jgi:hypothetical protein